MRSRTLALTSALVVPALVLAACGDDPTAERTLSIAVAGLPTTGATGGATLADLAVVVTDDHDRPVADVALTLTVAGGGRLDATELVTGADGRAAAVWTLGPLPIVQTLGVASEDVTDEATVDVTTAAPLAPVMFGQLDLFLTGQGVDGSTEDLAFDPRPGGRGLVVGGDTMLVALSPSGLALPIQTTGEAFGRVLGLAFDATGRLYVADGGRKAILRVDVDGVVTKVADRDGDAPFEAPNDVAVGPDGAVYLSDSCSGKFLAFDEGGVVRGRATFDPMTDGGPNGVVVGPDGALWVTTENTLIFCGDDVGLKTPLGGLYRIEVLADGSLGATEAIARGVGVFGDGLAFDALGNLYAIFDTADEVELALDETIVFVLPRGGTALRRVMAARNKVWANVAFAPAAYGETTMLLSLLAVPGFTPVDARGVERIDVGVRGAPLPGARP